VLILRYIYRKAVTKHLLRANLFL